MITNELNTDSLELTDEQLEAVAGGFPIAALILAAAAIIVAIINHHH